MTSRAPARQTRVWDPWHPPAVLKQADLGSVDAARKASSSWRARRLRAAAVGSRRSETRAADLSHRCPSDLYDLARPASAHSQTTPSMWTRARLRGRPPV